MNDKTQGVSRRLKIGDTVMVYEDPHGKTKPEGKARLFQFFKQSPFNREYWYVCFSDGYDRLDKRAHLRLINSDDIL